MLITSLDTDHIPQIGHSFGLGLFVDHAGLSHSGQSPKMCGKVILHRPLIIYSLYLYRVISSSWIILIYNEAQAF